MVQVLYLNNSCIREEYLSIDRVYTTDITFTVQYGRSCSGYCWSSQISPNQF